MKELEERALFEYYNAKSAGEKSPKAIAAIFPDGTILSAATLTIYPVTEEEGKALSLKPEQSLMDKAIMRFGKQIPPPTLCVEIVANHHHPDQLFITYR